MYVLCVMLVVTVCPADAMMSASPSNNSTVVSLADSSLLHTSAAPSSLSHTVTVVTSSRHSLTESVGHCVERPTAVDSVRIVGNCVAPASSSVANHSSSLRGLGQACASTAVSFSPTPLLKSAGAAIHRMESVPRLVDIHFSH